jgi:clostripain
MIQLLLAILASFLAPVAARPLSPPAEKEWTILVYGAADNNADGPILNFLDSVRKALDDDPAVEMLLFIDRSEGYSKDARLLGEDFTGARLYRLNRDSAQRLAGGEHFPQITLEGDVELDSADAGNIARFVAWGKAQSPAKNYALLIYSHADGRSMCPDEASESDMGIPELTEKLPAEASVDFLALELCNMGGIEIAYQWRPDNGRFGADVLLAIPNAGPPLDWDRAFARIRSPGHFTNAGSPPIDPAKMTAVDFGKLVIEEGERGRRTAGGNGAEPSRESAGCYDLRRSGEVKEAVDDLSRALAASDARGAFLTLSSGVFHYDEEAHYPDLYALAKRAAQDQSLSPEVREAASLLMDRVDAFVIASFGMSGYQGFERGRNGVFIVLPPDRPEVWKRFRWYAPRAPGAEAGGGWAFLQDGATPSNGTVENWFELLDEWFEEDGSDVNAYRP